MARRARPAVIVGFGLLGFLAVVAIRSQPADPDARLPRRFRLVGLIHREQAQAVDLRAEADRLRDRLTAIRRDAATRHSGSADADRQLNGIEANNGLVAVTGPGVKVTLDDSSMKQSPTGNVNDLVIHSQDVQAVANGLWGAGAEALAVNGQRVVPTSAILCVGNTLLINGTVHSPPFRFTALGAQLHTAFTNDPLVQRFAEDADRFKLGFKVEDKDRVDVPAYTGTTQVRFARAG